MSEWEQMVQSQRVGGTTSGKRILPRCLLTVFTISAALTATMQPVASAMNAATASNMPDVKPTIIGDPIGGHLEDERGGLLSQYSTLS